MTTASPASATTPNTPAAGLSIHAAASMLDAQDAAAQATPATTAPTETAQTETDTPQEAAPEQVEDGAPEDDESAPEDETQEDADPDGDYVEVDDEKILVEDLVKTYKRFNDFRAQVTRKEQALADERRTLQEQRQTVENTVAEVTRQVMAREAEADRARQDAAKEMQRYREQIEALSPIVNAAAKEWENFDWDKLAAEDPMAVGLMQVKHQKFLNSQRQLAAEKAELDRKQQAEHLQLVERAKTELHQHITTHHPELTDPEKGSQLWRDMVATAKDAGLTDEVILAATGQAADRGVRPLDPANLNLWIKATKYDRLARESSSVTKTDPEAKAPELPRMRVVKGTAPRPRPGTVERARIGGVSAAFAAKPTIENALAILDAREAYKARRPR